MFPIRQFVYCKTSRRTRGWFESHRGHAIVLRVASLTAAALFVVLSPALAQITVFDNGLPDRVGGEESDADFGPTGTYVGDEFVLGTTTSFNQVQWFGYYIFTPQPTNENFTILFHGTTFNSSGYVPNGATLPGLGFNVGNVERFDTGTTINVSHPIYRYVATLPTTITLAPEGYGISIFANENGSFRDWHWATSSQSGGSFRFRRNDLSAEYLTGGFGRMSFQLISAPVASVAPEPASLALLTLIGLPFVGTTIRRKRISQRRRAK